MKTAVIYARYSSDAQSEQSIEGQVRVCKQFAEKNDLLIVDQYIDRALTGTNDNRAAFQQMLKDSKRRQWSVVLVYKLDRFKLPTPYGRRERNEQKRKHPLLLRLSFPASRKMPL